jgi:Tfp pilus assembly protein PilO
MKSLMPITLVVISLGLFYLHISPQYDGVKVLMAQEGEYQEALEKTEELANRRDELLTTYNSFSQDNLNRLARILPTEVNTVKLVTDLNALAGRYQTTLRRIEVMEEVVDNGQVIALDGDGPKLYYTTTISFQFSSSYENLVLFLKDLERSLQMVDVKSVTFDAPDEQTVTGLYDYSVSIQTYWLK